MSYLHIWCRMRSFSQSHLSRAFGRAHWDALWKAVRPDLNAMLQYVAICCNCKKPKWLAMHASIITNRGVRRCIFNPEFFCHRNTADPTSVSAIAGRQWVGAQPNSSPHNIWKHLGRTWEFGPNTIALYHTSDWNVENGQPWALRNEKRVIVDLFLFHIEHVFSMATVQSFVTKITTIRRFDILIQLSYPLWFPKRLDTGKY